MPAVKYLVPYNNTAQTTNRNLTKNQNHSQLIQTQEKWEKEKRESKNGGAALNDSVIAPHVKWWRLTKWTLQGCLLGTEQSVRSPFCRWTDCNHSECELRFLPYCDRKSMIALRKKPLPEFPDRSVIQNGSCGSSTEHNRGPNMIEPSPETSRTKPVQLLREEERGCPTWAILCARAARVILNHAPIGEYRARFYPQEPTACPCER